MTAPAPSAEGSRAVTEPPSRGWCPTLFRPMRSGDGWLARVRPPAGVLRGSETRALAAAAARDGNGSIELTNRANLQIRGLSEATLPRFAAAMVELGLAHSDPDVEQRRSIIATPLAGDDPTVSRHAAAIARELETRLARRTRLAALPPKFGFLVDGGGVLPVASAMADIRVVVESDACRVVPDAAGEILGLACAPEDAAEVAVRVAEAFVDLAAVCQTAPRRMRALIDAVGALAVFEAAGLVGTGTPDQFQADQSRVMPMGVSGGLHRRDDEGARPHSCQFTRGPISEAAQPGTSVLVGAGRAETGTAPNSIGWLPYGTSGRGAFGVGLPFGALDVSGLLALSDLSERFGDGTLRMTPWRCLMIPGVTQPDPLSAAVTLLGLVAEPSDPRLRVFACPGVGACGSASVATRVDALTFAGLGISGTLHVSGCAKGCAHRGNADVTLVGEAGRYDVVLNGRSGDVPYWRGVAAADIASLLTGIERRAAS
jgi:precorrin-3B synthase